MTSPSVAPAAADRHQHRDWLLSLVALPPGAIAVDLGCGRGEDLLALAERHPDPATRFIGWDAAEHTITAARATTRDARVSFQIGSLAGQLPLADASVDLVFSQNLVECLIDPGAFVQEVARVLRPGGMAVIAHWDFDTQVYDGTDKALVRRIVHAFADMQQGWMEHADGWMGRRLHGLFAPTGFFDGDVHAGVMMNTRYAPSWFGHSSAQSFRSLVKRGIISAEDYDRFIADLEALDRAGRYFYSITGYAYVGRRRAGLRQANERAGS